MVQAHKAYQSWLVNSLALGIAARGVIAEAKAPLVAPRAKMAVIMKLVCMMVIGIRLLILLNIVEAILRVLGFCFVETAV
jgi:capsular polysaccharide biosynthesis protein